MLPSAMLVLAAQPLHDPEVYCTACIRLVANLQDAQGLVPMLRSAVTLAKTTKPELGALDALAEEYVIERGCKWYATWNNLTIRKACLHITEEHGESLVEKITRWATKERPDSELLGALCSKAVRACSTKDLVAYKGMHPKDKQYRSERPPEGANDGPEFTAVAETLNAVVTEIGVETLLYVYFTGSARHAKLAPRYRQLAQLVAKQAGRPSQLRIATIDARKNEIPPPHGLDIHDDAIVLYPARQKGDKNSNPRPIEWLEPERSLPEVIVELRNAVKTPQAREHLERLSKAYTKRDVERWERVGHGDTLPDARDRGRDSTRMAPRDRLGSPKDDL